MAFSKMDGFDVTPRRPSSAIKRANSSEGRPATPIDRSAGVPGLDFDRQPNASCPTSSHVNRRRGLDAFDLERRELSGLDIRVVPAINDGDAIVGVLDDGPSPI